MDDNVPPPPYSEIDPSPNHLIRSRLEAGDRSELSTSSNDSDTLSNSLLGDTSSISPALSSRTCHLQSNYLEDDASSSQSVAAQAYFLSREPLNLHREPHEIYYLPLHPGIQPSDLPYEAHFAARDITEQDWATFLNFLIPDHSTLSNDDIVSQKLQDEFIDKQLQCLTLGNCSPSTSSFCNASTQLKSSLTSKSYEITQSKESIISEWNNSFFIPRGLELVTIKDDMNEPLTSITDKTSIDQHENLGQEDKNEVTKYQSNPDSLHYLDTNDSNSDTLATKISGIRDGNTSGVKRTTPVANAMGNILRRAKISSRPQDSRPESDKLLQRQTQPQSHRNRSESISTLESSASISESITSVDSLPDHNFLSPQQLINARNILLDWIRRPLDNPVSQIVRQLKHDLYSLGVEQVNTSQNDLKAQRAEVEHLFKKIRSHQRAQRRKVILEKKKQRAASRLMRHRKRADHIKSRHGHRWDKK